MDPNTILDKARNSISDFCINECKALCCRSGILTLKKDEISIVAPNSRLVEHENLFYLRLKDGCPKLDGSICTIHNNKKRPKVCHNYPLFLRENKIIVSNHCLAVKLNKLYPYLAELKSSGFEIEYK